MEAFIQIFTTTEVKGDAEKIARALVEERLAGCVQIIGPIISIYRWEDAVERSEEWLCSVKTSKLLSRKVEEVIRTLHPYEVPELIALPIVGGSDDYLGWLGEQLRK